jgi:SMI1-KNR4 cell-wall
MSRYTQLFANLKAVDDSWKSIGPQPAARVDEIEAKFGIQLPKSFRQVLTEVGGIEYPNHYFTSINDDYLDSQDGFMCNTNMLREQAGHLPDGLIALEADHDADQWACLDLNRMVNGECPVVWYHAFEGRLIGDCASSFEEFFQRLVEEWTG